MSIQDFFPLWEQSTSSSECIPFCGWWGLTCDTPISFFPLLWEQPAFRLLAPRPIMNHPVVRVTFECLVPQLLGMKHFCQKKVHWMLKPRCRTVHTRCWTVHTQCHTVSHTLSTPFVQHTKSVNGSGMVFVHPVYISLWFVSYFCIVFTCFRDGLFLEVFLHLGFLTSWHLGWEVRLRIAILRFFKPTYKLMQSIAQQDISRNPQ